MKDIEQFLRDNKPQAPEEGQFLIETNARLSAVEGIKKTVDGERRRWRTALVTALLTGLVSGVLLMAFITLYPVKPMQADGSILEKAALALEGRKEILIGIIAACALALGTVFMTRKKEAI